MFVFDSKMEIVDKYNWYISYDVVRAYFSVDYYERQALREDVPGIADVLAQERGGTALKSIVRLAFYLRDELEKQRGQPQSLFFSPKAQEQIDSSSRASLEELIRL